MAITLEQLKRFAPNGRADILQIFIDRADLIRAADINTFPRVHQFMAEVAVESQGLSRLEENLRYSSKRLMEVWPKRFPTMSSTLPFANNPQALANKVYGGRLGNTQPGDGWRYRGSGLMQTTGRANFADAGHEDDPDTLRQPLGALQSALQFWTKHNLNALADKNDILSIRKIINGGTNGLDDAKAYLVRAKKIFV